jgi:hypothetical protein
MEGVALGRAGGRGTARQTVGGCVGGSAADERCYAGGLAVQDRRDQAADQTDCSPSAALCVLLCCCAAGWHGVPELCAVQSPLSGRQHKVRAAGAKLTLAFVWWCYHSSWAALLALSCLCFLAHWVSWQAWDTSGEPLILLCARTDCCLANRHASAPFCAWFLLTPLGKWSGVCVDAVPCCAMLCCAVCRCARSLVTMTSVWQTCWSWCS